MILSNKSCSSWLVIKTEILLSSRGFLYNAKVLVLADERTPIFLYFFFLTSSIVASIILSIGILIAFLISFIKKCTVLHGNTTKSAPHSSIFLTPAINCFLTKSGLEKPVSLKPSIGIL